MSQKFSTINLLAIVVIILGFVVATKLAGEKTRLTGDAKFFKEGIKQLLPKGTLKTKRSAQPQPKSTTTPGSRSLNDLGITIGGGSQRWVDLFASFARDGNVETADELGFTENTLKKNQVQFENLISQVEKGRINYNFASYQNALQNIEYLKDKVDSISYDLEKWEKSLNEWQDISGFSQKMSKLAHSYGLLYKAGLSYQLAKNQESIESMAEFADIYGPHSHSFLKTDPDGYVEFMRSQAERARSRNPNVVIEIMVSTAEGTPSVQKLLEIIKKSLDFADRVMIYHDNSEESYQKTDELIKMLRT